MPSTRANGCPMRAWLFLGPALLVMAVYLVYPTCATLWLSFQDASGDSFAGLRNWRWLATDAGFRAALGNTLLWLLVVPAAATSLGLLAAGVTESRGWGRLARAVIFMPMAVSFVGAGVVWKFVYDARPPQEAQIGLLNAVVTALGGQPQAWIALPFWNNLFLMVIVIWIQTGLAMVILTAAMRKIPRDVIEAATLDGASGWQAFVWIVIPQIRGAIAVAWTVISLTVLKLFDVVQAMTNGQWSTDVLANLMFDWMFRGGGDFGRGAAIAVVIMTLVIPFMIWTMRHARAEAADSRDA